MREFRARHDDYQAAGVQVAGISLDSVETNRAWAGRLRLPYPLLSDARREAGAAFHVVRRVGIGGWGLEFFRRSTFLVDTDGTIAAVWSRVATRGHPAAVLDVARALVRAGPG